VVAHSEAQALGVVVGEHRVAVDGHLAGYKGLGTFVEGAQAVVGMPTSSGWTRGGVGWDTLSSVSAQCPQWCDERKKERPKRKKDLASKSPQWCDADELLLLRAACDGRRAVVGPTRPVRWRGGGRDCAAAHEPSEPA
jgi:hypothetical protein